MRFRVAALPPGASILLDFGRELHGALQLNSGPMPGNAVAQLRLRFGESASEAMGAPNNDHAMHDFPILLPPMAAQEYGMTGFRFARLDNIGAIEVPIVAARAISLMRPLDEIGSFECSDARLNQIWRVGADTVALCMQDFLWDGIKRDRLVWMGDLHPEVAVVSAVWGAHPIVPGSLDWGARPHQSRRVDERHRVVFAVVDSDSARLVRRARRPRLFGCGNGSICSICCRNVLEQIGEDGEISWRGWRFLDWPSSALPHAVDAGLVALLVMTLEAARELCALWGEAAMEGRCRAALETLRGLVLSVPADSKQASSLLALADLAPATAINENVLALHPLEGLSTFYGYYVLQARALAGDTDGALEVIRRYWGAMLDLGATSFWEHFELEWAQGAARIDEIPGANTARPSPRLRRLLLRGLAPQPVSRLGSGANGVALAARFGHRDFAGRNPSAHPSAVGAIWNGRAAASRRALGR